MQLTHWPTYCGGRILTNLFTENSDKKTPDHLIAYRVFSSKVPAGSKPCQIPQTIEYFGYMLRRMLCNGGNLKTKTDCGTVLAVTNSRQTLAAKFLEQLGFICVADNEKVAHYGKCKTWIADYHAVLWPKLAAYDKPKELEEHEKAEAARLATPGLIKSLNGLKSGQYLWFITDNPDGGSAYGRKGERVQYVTTMNGRIQFSLVDRPGQGTQGSRWFSPAEALTSIDPASEKEKGLSFKNTPAVPPVQAPGAPSAQVDPQAARTASSGNHTHILNDAPRISKVTGKPVRKYTRKDTGYFGWL